MITADGWIDWAIRMPGPAVKTNQTGFANPAIGIFLHSAEGYELGLWSILEDVSPPLNRRTSWHLSNLMDGTLYQHYPLTACCWHATAANNRYIGMEHEGKVPEDPSLTEAQIVTSKAVISELEQWKGWKRSRPSGPTDVKYTCWEHNEVVRLGGSASSCPSGRIPWNRIMEQDMLRQEGNFLVLYHGDVPIRRWGSNTAPENKGRESWNFGGNWLWVRHFTDEGIWDPVGKLSDIEGD